jgi:hypothetical protein
MNERRRELIEQYRSGGRAIVGALSGVDLDSRPAENEWSPREIVHHVADAEITRSVRLRRLLAEDDPHIASFEQDVYAQRLHYDRPIEHSLAVIEAAVQENVGLLARLSDDEWARDGSHDEFGRFGVDVWLARSAEHAHAHAEQIRRCGH